MTDRELLELAAKAAGYRTDHPMNAAPLTLTPAIDALVLDKDGRVTTGWNPLHDDGDALRLAVRLKLEVGVWVDSTRVESDEAESAVEKHGLDPYAATRRAVVRAAAAIGEAMP